MNITFHIHFNGQCQEAFEFYEEALNAKIGTMLRFGDSPAAETVAIEWHNKIVHGNINLNGVEISGDDIPDEQSEPPKGFYILLGIDNESETTSVFNRLSENGTIIMPLQKTFWSTNYGIVIDQFGIQWKINGTT